MVAQYCILIAPDKRSGDLAWIAALLHSFDHLFAEGADPFIPPEEQEKEVALERMMQMYLSLLPESVSDDEQRLIVDASLTHKSANSADDSDVKITLQDADRLANIGALVIVRGAQYHPSIPAAELDYLDRPNPASTYRDPQSVMDNIRDCLDWEDNPKFGLRLPEAKRTGAKHFAYLRAYFQQIKLQFEEVGLYPWPIEED